MWVRRQINGRDLNACSLLCRMIDDTNFKSLITTTVPTRKHPSLPHRSDCFLWEVLTLTLWDTQEMAVGAPRVCSAKVYIFSRMKYAPRLMTSAREVRPQPNILFSSWTRLYTLIRAWKKVTSLFISSNKDNIWGKLLAFTLFSWHLRQKNNTKTETSCTAYKVTPKLKVQPVYFTSLSPSVHTTDHKTTSPYYTC